MLYNLCQMFSPLNAHFQKLHFDLHFLKFNYNHSWYQSCVVPVAQHLDAPGPWLEVR